GLHVGEVFYGNIGSTERLDFTVVGPAVNETSRIAAMCRSVDQPVLVSEAFTNVDGDAQSSHIGWPLCLPCGGPAARTFHIGSRPHQLAVPGHGSLTGQPPRSRLVLSEVY